MHGYVLVRREVQSTWGQAKGRSVGCGSAWGQHKEWVACTYHVGQFMKLQLLRLSQMKLKLKNLLCSGIDRQKKRLSREKT